VRPEVLEELQNNLLVMYSGVERPAKLVLTSKANASRAPIRRRSRHASHQGARSGRLRFARAREVECYGELLHEHWQHKRRLASRMTDDTSISTTKPARQAGAIGGKLIGAGGGGFFMFYVRPAEQRRVVRIAQRTRSAAAALPLRPRRRAHLAQFARGLVEPKSCCAPHACSGSCRCWDSRSLACINTSRIAQPTFKTTAACPGAAQAEARGCAGWWWRPLGRSRSCARRAGAFPIGELTRADDSGFPGFLEVLAAWSGRARARGVSGAADAASGPFRVSLHQNPTPEPASFDFVTAVESGEVEVFVEVDPSAEPVPARRARAHVDRRFARARSVPRVRYECGDGRFVGVTLIEDQAYRPQSLHPGASARRGSVVLHFTPVPASPRFVGFAGFSYFLERDVRSRRGRARRQRGGRRARAISAQRRARLVALRASARRRRSRRSARATFAAQAGDVCFAAGGAVSRFAAWLKQRPDALLAAALFVGYLALLLATAGSLGFMRDEGFYFASRAPTATGLRCSGKALPTH